MEASGRSVLSSGTEDVRMLSLLGSQTLRRSAGSGGRTLLLELPPTQQNMTRS